MSVASISANPLYSVSLQYQYLGTTISEQKIKSLMAEYGIKPSGNADYDLQQLHNIMLNSASSQIKAKFNAQAPQTQQQPPALPEVVGNTASVPWANLMSQVGATLTGVFETDYEAFNQIINSMSISATNQQERANIDQLVAQAGVVFVKPEQSAAVAQVPLQTQQTQKQSISGTEILAQLNRMYALG